MKLRKQGHYVATPKFGLGFSVVEPLRISSKRSKEISSSQYTSVEEMKEVKGKKIKQRATVLDCIGGLTPLVSVFERLSHKGERVSSKHLKEFSTTSKTSIFCCLGASRKSTSRKILSKHKEQVHEERDHFEVVADKENCCDFPSRMKRKSILSISTDGPLKVQRRTIVYTCQPSKESKKEKEAMPTIQGSQREKSDFVETSYHITMEDIPCLNVDDEVHEAPPQLEDSGQSTMDELKELDLGTSKDPRLTCISELLMPQEEEEYSKLLTEYKDVFAWSYKEMPGFSPKSQRMFRPELVSQIEIEVNKLIEAGFIREVKYPSWISNIVPVKKKNGQIRVCVDFRDLNTACPKDDFPLPIIELMIDATTGHEAISFMDGSSGYNQIRMSPKDEECTAFRTPKGIYCYKVMSFGLKNVGSTYQHAM
uniref:Uncharacterized protein LOC104236226 n=1 Tax=Nicotiana sylvestris TaxID=4096 RepID=A0A1U7XPJ8_NICSY|nr:PREDICTED: uncharacterized protein LOC104236226 [Nicotiana sylvestris]